MSKKATKRPTPGQRALAALKEVHADVRGDDVRGIVEHRPVDVKAVRVKTGLSQAVFASTYGLSAATVRDWEQNRKVPERTAQLYLWVIEAAPEVVKKVVAAVA
jgi:putative transcriptional regulator